MRGKTCVSNLLIIGFGFTSNWLRKWHEIFWPITKHSNAKPKQFRNYFLHSTENCSNLSFYYCCNSPCLDARSWSRNIVLLRNCKTASWLNLCFQVRPLAHWKIIQKFSKKTSWHKRHSLSRLVVVGHQRNKSPYKSKKKFKQYKNNRLTHI